MGLQEVVFFCCFVHILSYDTVREGKAMLQIDHSMQKPSRFKDLSIGNKWHVHGHSRVFHSPGIEVNLLFLVSHKKNFRSRIVLIFPSALS